jgi:hypothetical protein
MTSAENSIGATVFWERLPLSIATSVVCFVLLEVEITSPLFPGIANNTSFLVIVLLYFVSVQVAMHWLMLGMNKQVYGRAPTRIDIGQEKVSCWIPPPRRELSQAEGGPTLVEVPFDHFILVNPLGIPGAIAPYARVRAAGLNLPKDFFLVPMGENFALILTRSNALALGKALTAWKGSVRPPPSVPLP